MLKLAAIVAGLLIGCGGQTAPPASAPPPPASTAAPLDAGSAASPDRYRCGNGTCTCPSVKACATMGADHVCAEGTFKANGDTGSCTMKP